MFERSILRGLMLALGLALVVALLLPSLALADPCGPQAAVTTYADHDVGTIKLKIGDSGHVYGPFWPCDAPCTDHTDWGCLAVGDSPTNMRDGC